MDKKIIIFGRFSKNIKITNGQVVKSNTILSKLKNHYPKIKVVNTGNTINRFFYPIILFFAMFYLFVIVFVFLTSSSFALKFWVCDNFC